jgi:hypothetical protein
MRLADGGRHALFDAAAENFKKSTSKRITAVDNAIMAS